MPQKVYYDAVNNKEVVDVSGLKDEAAVTAEFGLDAGRQVLTVDPAANEAHEVVGGVLQKFDAKARSDAAAAARESARAGKETAIKAKLGLTDQDFDDLKEALG
jgi:hypothetical protein